MLARRGRPVKVEIKADRYGEVRVDFPESQGETFISLEVEGREVVCLVVRANANGVKIIAPAPTSHIETGGQGFVVLNYGLPPK